ncbi:signal peptidase I [Nocardioides cavernaquae]|uniref:Signal peptidase I n=1 Tax=Nocardioides cavernaquae TaxID=2321396 RepID=A0A3A5HCN4_9ACTN|nr:signal peptidase I [Nocardioides cavernaquae]
MGRRWSAAAVLALGSVAFHPPQTSSATWSATTSSSATVRAASDWTVPTVAVRDPGSPLRNTVTITADAADADSSLASVVIEAQPSGGGTWTTLCTATGQPWSCSWDTRTVSDGGHLLRARATDSAGNAATSAVVSTAVANSLLVLLDNPGDPLRGNVPLSAHVYNAGILTLTTRIEYSVAGSDNWKTACSGLGSELTCTWSTGALTSQEYDLRAVAVVGTTTYASAVITDVLVDNTAPSVTLTDPGSPLRGTVTLAAAASDAHSGIATVVHQYAVTGSSTWLTACTATTSPWSCRFDTSTTADGSYGFRAVATDAAGNSTTSAVLAARSIDNTVSSVSVEDPGSYLAGVVTVGATANSTAGVASVRIQRAPSGTSTWTDLCTDTSATYSCSWDTRTETDGLYDLRALLVDGHGGTTISATVSGRRVDNSPLRGVDVQTVNGGASAGKPDAGDQLVLSYSTLVNPATITAGWTGSPLAVSLRLRDGGLLGLGGRGDTIDVLRSGSPVGLGSVLLGQEYVKSGKTVAFNATMTASTGTVGGVPATIITVTLGTVASGTGIRGGNPSTMVWTPSASATDISGTACATAPVTESGPLDRDY